MASSIVKYLLCLQLHLVATATVFADQRGAKITQISARTWLPTHKGKGKKPHTLDMILSKCWKREFLVKIELSGERIMQSRHYRVLKTKLKKCITSDHVINNKTTRERVSQKVYKKSVLVPSSTSTQVPTKRTKSLFHSLRNYDV